MNKRFKDDNKLNADIFQDHQNFVIDTNYIKVVTKENYISYTFKIEREQEKVGFIENLMVENKNGVENAYIISYIPNGVWLRDFLNGIQSPFYGNVRIEKLRSDNNYQKEPTLKASCETTYVSIETSCGCQPNHWPGQQCNCSTPPSSQLHRFKVCSEGTTEGPVGGGGAGGGGGGSSDDGDTTGDGSVTPITGADGHDVDTVGSLTTMLQLNSEQSDWLSRNNDFTDIVYTFIATQQFTTEAVGFAKDALLVVMQGGEVDFEEQVILDDSFTSNNRLNGIYEDMGKAPTFKGYLENFDGDMSVANLRFGYEENFGAVYSEQTSAMAVTNAPENYLIKIVFNGDSSLSSSIHNKPDLIIALGFIHEIIHAEMYRRMLSAAQNDNLDPETMTEQQQINYAENLRNNFPGIFDYYWERYKPNWNHQQMAQHYRNIISNAIAEYDDHQYSEDFYNALSWMGLMGTGQYDPQTGLYENSTEAWKQIDENPNLSGAQERISIRNTIINFQNSN